MFKYHPSLKKTLTYNPYGTQRDKISTAPLATDIIKFKPVQTIIAPQYNHTSTPSPPLPTKGKNLRLAYINANGIKTNLKDRYKEILSYMHINDCDIFGITETNIHWNNGEVYRTLMKEAKKYTEDSRTNIIPSDTKVEWNNRYKPGGTLTVVTGKLTTMIMEKEIDSPLGRWSSVTIGPPTHQLVIITAYIVNNTIIDPKKIKLLHISNGKYSVVTTKDDILVRRL